jgi:hypothetical protein
MPYPKIFESKHYQGEVRISYIFYLHYNFVFIFIFSNLIFNFENKLLISLIVVRDRMYVKFHNF